MLAAIPVDAAEASFLRSIDALRVASGADWQSITPSRPGRAGQPFDDHRRDHGAGHRGQVGGT